MLHIYYFKIIWYWQQAVTDFRLFHWQKRK